MTLDNVLLAFSAVAFGAGPVWLYLHCVRPALVWHRARAAAHVGLGAASVVPAAVLLLAPDSRPLVVVAYLAAMVTGAGWVSPRGVVRATGGAAAPTREVDVVSGWLAPAATHMDVGDLRSAAAQVREARRHATAATARYVELWDALVREERRRRRGERISRRETLEAIHEEYTRLILGTGPVWQRLELAAPIAIAAGVLVRVMSPHVA